MGSFETKIIPYEQFKEDYNEIIELDKEVLKIPSFGRATAISNVYFKFGLMKELKYARAQFFTEDGKPATILIGERSSGVYPKCKYFDLHGRVIREMIMGNLPKFEKLTLFFKETGRNKEEDRDEISLKLMIGSPGKKVNAGNTKKLVPACSKCNGLLFSSYYGRYNAPKDCIYCGEPLGKYWRERKIYELELSFNKEDLEDEVFKKRYASHASSIPIWYKGKLFPIELGDQEQYHFLLNYSNLFPNGVVGPFIISLSDGYWTHGREYRYGSGPDYNMHEIAIMSHDLPDFPAMELFPKSLIYPKNAFYKENISMKERLKQGEADVAAGVERAKKAEISKEKRKQKVAEELSEIIDLNDIASRKGVLDIRKRLTNMYIKMGRSARKTSRDYHDGSYSYSAQFYINLYNDKGQTVGLTASLTTGKQVSMTELQFTDNGLQSFMDSIQRNDGQHFSEVKFFALESVVKYKDKDPHYYLNPILNTPGVVYRVPRSKYKVKACKSCDAMLLNYSFSWSMQKEDLKEKVCPYCKENLDIIERDRRVVPVTLDFNSTGCRITGTNNQIGVIYNGVPVKLTVKVKALMHFFQNYQNLFPNSIMGPFKARLTYRNRIGMIEDIRYVITMDKVEWRPVVLYPEDLIAF